MTIWLIQVNKFSVMSGWSHQILHKESRMLCNIHVGSCRTHDLLLQSLVLYHQVTVLPNRVDWSETVQYTCIAARRNNQIKMPRPTLFMSQYASCLEIVWEIATLLQYKFYKSVINSITNISALKMSHQSMARSLVEKCDT